MNNSLYRSWWMPALRGLIALSFGVVALMVPAAGWYLLLMLFAAYALLGGILSIIGAVRHRKVDEDWWLPLLLGVVGIAAGVVAVLIPGLTLLVLVLLIGANALVGGVLDIAIAVRLRRKLRNEWLLLLNGAVSIAFGFLVFLMPDLGALAVAYVIGIYAIISGVLLLALAWRLRQPAGKVERAPQERRAGGERRAAFAH
ncbi:HdeD family acid-resistance protein [Pseudoduganella sp.]|uniref:HdeD family acid-resistance protein n=1 Tax=Pseudoduganella sp. TaxID=1880898 RepID=UPI0035B2518B